MYNILIVCVLIIFSAITAFAEIYSWTDEKGVKHYSTIHPEYADGVKTSDEIRHNAQEDKAREREHEKWMNQKNRGEKMRTLKTTRRTEVEQNKTENTVIYVKSSRRIHKHIKNVKRESSPKVRTEAKKERIKSQKASPLKSSQKNNVRTHKKIR